MLALFADMPELRVALVIVMVTCAAALVATLVTYGNVSGCAPLMVCLVVSVAAYAACVTLSSSSRSTDVHLSESFVSMRMVSAEVGDGMADVRFSDATLGDVDVNAIVGAWSSSPRDTFEVVVDDEANESVLVFAKRADSRVAGQLSHSDYARHVVARVNSSSPLATYKLAVPSVDLGAKDTKSS
jgi:hypothetical protein